MVYLVFKFDWQEEQHSIKHVDAAKKIDMLLEHAPAHVFAGHLRVERYVVLVEMEIWSTVQFEQVRDELDPVTSLACNQQIASQRLSKHRWENTIANMVIIQASENTWKQRTGEY